MFPPTRPDPGLSTGAASSALEREGVTAFIGHVKRASGWVLPRQLRAVALMGGIDLDLSKARLAPGEAEMELVAVMGVVRVQVPPEVRVECRGDAITFTNKRRRPDALLPTATTTIWITGRAIMGAIQVELVDRETE